ncbi:hypothetical protein AB0I28_22655 [Phytomonospora sp. NPDC050363]|uniref:hypothetical protein n=1 Tax=Phytomonospora sp. NPDC050363 TaxID=3155642 RepID=UPI0033D83593
MTTVQWDASITTAATPAEVEQWFADHLRMFNPHGTRGTTVRLGPDDADLADLPLRIDIDPDTDRAAVRWLPDDHVAVDLPPLATPLLVCEWTDEETLTEVPGALARVDVRELLEAAAPGMDTATLTEHALTLGVEAPAPGAQLVVGYAPDFEPDGLWWATPDDGPRRIG